MLLRLRGWVRAIVRQSKVERDMREEMRIHLDRATERYRQRGMSAVAARAAAMREFGNLASIQEDARDARGVRRITDVIQDVRYALRGMRSKPGFTIAVVATLAIGIGANTALFSVVRTVLLDPLPYPRSDELVVISKSPWNRAEFAVAFRGMHDVFDDVAAYSPEPVAITDDEQAYQLEAAGVTSNFFHLFGTSALLGRDFRDGDVRRGAAPTAIISYTLWTSRFGSRPDILGQTIRVNDQSRQIIGVTRPGFSLIGPRADDPQVWLPLELRPLDTDGRPLWVIPVMRMRAGVSVAQAQAAVDNTMPTFIGAHLELGSREQWTFPLATIKSEVVKDVRTALIVLQLTAVALLLIACVNVANLLLARANARQREVAIRSALGASRGQLVRQLVTETMVLSAMGGVVGVVLMRATLGVLVRIAPAGVPRLADVRLDMPTFLFAIAVAAGTGLLVGLIPALAAQRGAPYEYLKEGGRGPSHSGRQRRISHGLVVLEVMLTLVLLVSATLFAQSFVRLSAQPLGFRTLGVGTMPIQLPRTRYDSVQQLDAFYTAVLERMSVIPGVQSVALANNLPIRRGNARRDYETLAGAGNSAVERAAQYGVVSPGYFTTLGIPLRMGRDFSVTDRRDGPKVAIIDEAMAREAFPGEDPLGKKFRFQEGNDAWLTVVGVVGNTRGAGLAEGVSPGFYIPYTQRPSTVSEIAVGHIAVFLVRSTVPTSMLAAPVRDAIHAVSPQQPTTNPRSLAGIVADGAAPQRFRAVLLGTFAGIALVLVVVGIYGVIEYAVVERTREFGIRMALGAEPKGILAGVLLWGLHLAGVGALLGVVASIAVSHFLASLLFGVAPTDPLTFSVALGTIGAVTVVACVLPARRATRVDPCIALQVE